MIEMHLVGEVYVQVHVVRVNDILYPDDHSNQQSSRKVPHHFFCEDHMYQGYYS